VSGRRRGIGPEPCCLRRYWRPVLPAIVPRERLRVPVELQQPAPEAESIRRSRSGPPEVGAGRTRLEITRSGRPWRRQAKPPIRLARAETDEDKGGHAGAGGIAGDKRPKLSNGEDFLPGENVACECTLKIRHLLIHFLRSYPTIIVSLVVRSWRRSLSQLRLNRRCDGRFGRSPEATSVAVQIPVASLRDVEETRHRRKRP